MFSYSFFNLSNVRLNWVIGFVMTKLFLLSIYPRIIRSRYLLFYLVRMRPKLWRIERGNIFIFTFKRGNICLVMLESNQLLIAGWNLKTVTPRYLTRHPAHAKSQRFFKITCSIHNPFWWCKWTTLKKIMLN